MLKTITISLQDGESSKDFEIKQMGAYSMERWARRAGILIVGTGILKDFDIDNIKSSADVVPIVAKIIVNSNGFAALANVDREEFDRLHDELLQCCYIVKGKTKMQLTPIAIEGNIEDYRTIFKLVWEALKLNLNFSIPESGSASESPTAQSDGRKLKISAR